MKTPQGLKCFFMAFVLGMCLGVRANNIMVTNVTWSGGPAEGTSWVTFDLSWENSWRAGWTEAAGNNVTGAELPVESWDAAWVFVKFRREGYNGHGHAFLATNAADHVMPAGATNSVGLTGGNGMGLFIYRAETGHGTFDVKQVKLLWLHSSNSVERSEAVDIQVHAIEMACVAEGPFALGSGGATETYRFHAGAETNINPFIVTAEWSGPVDPGTNARRIGNNAGQLYAIGAIGAAGTLHDDFPTGYDAFYCMKYEITQGQYADFLNSLSAEDAASCYPGQYGAVRHTIGESEGVYFADRPDRACNYLSWHDGARYACWAGLRPMTELEFEKACRGSHNPEPNENAWGVATRALAAIYLNVAAGQPETGAETVTNNVSLGAAHWGTTITGGDGGSGPLRVGIFATPGSTRVSSGATYWGIMEMSGNMWERTVTVGNDTGRAFTGKHGTGAISPLPAGWPGSAATGSGYRGGYCGLWQGVEKWLCVSDRVYAATTDATRPSNFGWRGVRSAP